MQIYASQLMTQKVGRMEPGQESFFPFHEEIFHLAPVLGFVHSCRTESSGESGAVGMQTLKGHCKASGWRGGSLNVAIGHLKKFWDVIPNLSFCMNSHKPEPTNGRGGMQ